MLLSRLYRAAQDELGDTLFALAAANWSEWHLSTLPGGARGVVAGRAALERGGGPFEPLALLHRLQPLLNPVIIDRNLCKDSWQCVAAALASAA